MATAATLTTAPTAQQLINSALISDPVSLASSIANSGWNDWTQSTNPYVKDQVSLATSDARNLAGNEFSAANQNIGTRNQLTNDFSNIYRQSGAKLGEVVNNMGTEAYKSQQRGMAMADVQQQSDAQMQSAQRNLQRMGVNPNSGRMLAMANQNAIQTAAGKAGAAAASDRNVLKDYTAGLNAMNSIGLNTLQASNAMDSSAQKWATLGMDASKLGATLGIDYAKLSGSQADAFGGTAAKAAYAQNANTQTANAAQATKDANSIPNLILSGVVKAGATALDPLAKSAGTWAANKIGGIFDTPPTPTDMTGFITPSNPIAYTPTPVDTTIGTNFYTTNMDAFTATNTKPTTVNWWDATSDEELVAQN